VLAERTPELGVGVRRRVHEVDRLVVAAELEQPGHGVHAVGELVRLRAHRVGQVAHAPELAHEPLELGAVAQGDDRAEVALVVAHGHPVGDQDAVAVNEQQVVAREPAVEEVGEASRPDHLDGAPAHGVGRKIEQPARWALRTRMCPRRVHGHHTLAHPVKHRLALLQELGELTQLETEALPLQASRQRQRGQQPREQRDPRVEGDHRDDRAELVADRVLEHPDRHLADDRAVRGAQRHLRARRPSQRPLLDRQHRSPRQRGRIGADPPSDAVRVRVRIADAARVGDDDERRPGGTTERLGTHLDEPAAIPRGDRACNLRGGRDARSDREGALLVLVVEAAPDRVERQREPHEHRADQDEQLVEQDLAGQPTGDRATRS
jgi:hypothetical protein